MFAPRGEGYDSESEDEGRRRVQASMSKREEKPSLQAGGPDDKKKKKIKLPPQESIEQIWERFSKDQFTKALKILPFDPVPASTASVRANELLTAGYERAADECRRRVRKIIQECKRVNKRYRDPGFDLDWDLKWRKGNTLNYLGKIKFELSTQTARDPNSSVPKAVKRVHEIFEKPTFMKDINGSDVKQGGLGDCWLIASLSGLANIEGVVRRSCVEYNTKIGIYGFVFYRDGEWIYSIIDDKLFLKSPCWDDRSMQRDLLQQIDKDEAEATYRKTYQTGSKALFFGQNVDQNETWVPLMEKAYAKAHGDYASLIGGWIGEGLEDLTGGVTTDLLASDILDTDEFWDNELSKVNQEFLFGCSTGLLDGGHGNRDGIQERHAYNVVETKTLKNGTRLLKLRNPWAAKRRGIWEGAYSDGSKEWNEQDVQQELKHSFGSDSVFWITYEDMLRKFQHIDRTRLFREDGWRCSQRWIGVDVPWRAQWHEKFHVRLTRDSPLVLVLSQLDERYFKGLEGQYSFELSFRVHEQGKPDPEDYVVRSHANYLMERSVGVEIPDMAAGNYSIWISVRADRNWATRESVEAVVKRECRNKDENEKLAQVGRAYDLAHAKAAQHLAEVARRRRAADHSKAAGERKDERRTNWDRRRINREIQKAQNAKNLRKRERRKAERKAAAEKAAAEAAANKAAEEAADVEKKAVEEAPAATQKDAEGGAAEAGSTTAGSSTTEKTSNEQTLEKVPEEPSQGQDKVEPKGNDEGSTSSSSPNDDAAVQEKKEEQNASSTESSSDQTNESAKTEPKPDTTAQAQVAEPDQPTGGGGESLESKQHDNAERSGAPQEKPTHIDVPPHADPTEASESTRENGDGSPASTAVSTPQDTPLDTPQTEKANAEGSGDDEKDDKVPVPPVEGGPPPPALPVICQYHKDQEEAAQRRKEAAEEEAQQRQLQAQQQAAQQQAAQAPQPEPSYSEDDSSDSPVSDWEQLFDSEDDDKAKEPLRQKAAARAAATAANGGVDVGNDHDETDDESRPEPWGAVCIVGFRVYSHDEALELRVVMEGEALEEGGMGEKGAADLDDAQANAGGEREKKDEEKKPEEEKKDAAAAAAQPRREANNDDDAGYEADKDDGKPKRDADSNTDGFAPYQTIVSKGGDEFEKASAPVVVVDDPKNTEEPKGEKASDGA